MKYALILTFLAGISTLLGTIPIFVKFKNEKKIISSSLAFAAGIMLLVSIIELVPEGINYLKTNYHGIILISISFLSIMFGIFISTKIDKYIDKVNDSYLYKVGILTMIVIIIHNIPEGIITFIVSSNNIKLGITLSLAIAMHNIPEGISIAVPIYYSTKSKIKAFIYTLISALSEILGAIITSLFLYKLINHTILGIILNITAGIMISISIYKLLPTSKKYDNRKTTIFFIIGLIFMLISLVLNDLIS